jgi:hypothetical protein
MLQPDYPEDTPNPSISIRKRKTEDTHARPDRMSPWSDFGCHMSRRIEIRHVPDELRRKLKAPAALDEMSLPDYLMREAARLAERPTVEDLRRRLLQRAPRQAGPITGRGVAGAKTRPVKLVRGTSFTADVPAMNLKSALKKGSSQQLRRRRHYMVVPTAGPSHVPENRLG